MKRILSSILAISFVLTICCNTAHAAETDIVTRESPTLAYYYVKMVTGNSPGRIGFDFDVHANVASADRIGIERIKVYDALTGECAATLQGNTTNKLVATNTYIHGGTYWYTLSPNRPYYAEVTVFASAGSVYDSRVITTQLVISPS